MLFLEGVDPTIPEYVANGSYEPFIIIAAVPATSTTPAIPERYAPKEIRQWSDEDKKKVGLDAKAKTIISMALPDEAFHSIMHLRTANETWDTICVQYEDSKSTPVALVSSEIIPSQRSTLTITELDSDSEELSGADLSEFDESLALLTHSFKTFAKKEQFLKKLASLYI
ncbi:hypothetical protein L6452_34718 [Arctium lappa]|uniref:Uncharacterized protein n=1 Tax=Arctium lappa TaxID=4217 RepID=A0ACB8YK01_ARCLA|nr:hypothetical protein L6452_34718 [Arctium lappa]